METVQKINKELKSLLIDNGQLNLYGKKYIVEKWLQNQNLVSETSLIESDEDCDKSQTPSILVRFRVWDTNFSYALIKGFFASGGKPETLKVFSNKHNKDFFLDFENENLESVVLYLDKIFSSLNKEIRYRAYLTKKIKVEKELEETLESLKE